MKDTGIDSEHIEYFFRHLEGFFRWKFHNLVIFSVSAQFHYLGKSL